MTFVEFFDKTAAENVCAALAFPPERVILIGDSTKQMQKAADRYSRIFAERGNEVEFIVKSVSRNDLAGIVEHLCEIINTYDDCCFDLTGGGELYLVAMGIVKERYADKNVQLSRFNIKNNSVIDCDGDGNVVFESDMPEMTVEENIRAYGGDVVYDDLVSGRTYDWVIDAEFASDIDAIWQICREDVKLWNVQITVFDAINRNNLADEDSSAIVAAEEDVISYLGAKGIGITENKTLISKLYKSGLVTALDFSEGYLCVDFKDEQVKRALTKAGQALELKIYKEMLGVRNADGAYVYNDVKNGVCIDWDGDIHFDSDTIKDTENEIDVMAMRGIVPLFISCKNGNVDMAELYKLNSVSDRFGSKYAKKVLVATALDYMGEFAEYFRQRALDMNIKLVENAQDMTDPELCRILKNLCNG